MTTSGYSGTPLPKKLGIKPGAIVVTIDAPDGFDAILGPLPDGAHLSRVSTGETEPLTHGNPVLCFVTEASDLAFHLGILREALFPDRAVWICWPKRASKVPTDITEDVIRDLCLPLGLVDVKVCSVDAIWSGLRLVIRKELR